jgi:hypothetical protein
MKRNTLTLLVTFLITATFISSCKKDKYPPSLTLELEPYVIYHDNTKYTVYDALGNKDPKITDNILNQASVQQYIDLSTGLKYTLDDNGEFWSAEYLNANYKYPAPKAVSYSGNTPEVNVDFDPEIGVMDENEKTIDLAKSGLYTFTYTATDDGQTATRKVHLRVYNSYSNMNGIYISKLTRLSGNGNSLWTDNYEYGNAKKMTSFVVDESVDKRITINRFLDNKKLKGTIKGEDVVVGDTTETHLTLGTKKGEEAILESLVSGPIVDNDTYINSLNLSEDEAKDVETLIIVTNKTEDNITKGRITNVNVKDENGDAVTIPIFAIEYSVKRYKKNPDYTNGDKYEYGGETWEPLDGAIQNWNNSFRETFVKQAYWSPENESAINEASGH